MADSSQTPRSPTPSNEMVPGDLPERLLAEPPVLPPMPAAPASTSAYASVAYLVPVARAWLASRHVRRELQADLAAGQRALDRTLRAVGRVAREEQVDLPALREDMNRIDHAEEEHARACAEARKQAEVYATTLERLDVLEQERRRAVEEQSARVRELDRELRARAEEVRAAQAELIKIEGELKSAARRENESMAEAAATGTEFTDEITFGGTLEDIENRTLDVESKATSLARRREKAKSHATALEQKLAELRGHHDEARSELSARRKLLDKLEVERQKERVAHETKMKAIEGEQRAATEDIARHLGTLGTLLNLHRPEKTRLTPLYERIDELQTALGAREQVIVTLDAQAQSFDHAAFQRGLLTVGALLALLVILVAVLVFVVPSIGAPPVDESLG